MSGRVLFLVCALVVAGCGSPTAPSSMTLTNVAVTSPVFSGFNSEATIVVTDQATWETVWPQVHDGTAPERPVVDFTKEIVVVAAMGTQATGGYLVSFTGATLADGVLTVDVTMSSPGPRCITTQGFTRPVRVVRLARPAGRQPSVRFRITRRAIDC